MLSKNEPSFGSWWFALTPAKTTFMEFINKFGKVCCWLMLGAWITLALLSWWESSTFCLAAIFSLAFVPQLLEYCYVFPAQLSKSHLLLWIWAVGHGIQLAHPTGMDAWDRKGIGNTTCRYNCWCHYHSCHYFLSNIAHHGWRHWDHRAASKWHFENIHVQIILYTHLELSQVIFFLKKLQLQMAQLWFCWSKIHT